MISVNDKAAPRDTRVPNIETLRLGAKNLAEALKLMNYPGLRRGQDSIVNNVFACRDTIGLLPTGTGKTATFVIPTICLKWCTLIYSPLIALMKDQVAGLVKRGLQADYISSAHTDSENALAIRRWMSGDLQFLYVAPERLNDPSFFVCIEARKPDMVVVDEAHTISQWVDNFRPAYAKIGPFIGRFVPKVVLALTATATQAVEDEVRDVLGLHGAARIAFLPPRKNLKVTTHINGGSVGDLLSDINSHDGPTVVYFAKVKELEEVAFQLAPMVKGGALCYHGQMSSGSDRSNNQDMFMQGITRVMFATNAFGMGVDKADIRMIIHWDVAGSIESITQEQGRAGRDGLDAKCIVFVREESFRTHRFFIECGFPGEAHITKLFNYIQRSGGIDGSLCMTVRDIGFSAGVPPTVSESIMAILFRSGVLERKKAETRVSKCRLLLATSNDPKYLRYAGLVERFGKIDTQGFYEFDMEDIAAELGVKEPTIRANLKKLADAGVLSFVPPPSSQPIKIIGPLSNVDFKGLRLKAEDAYNKLQRVQEYVGVPDNEKEAYVASYFGIKL